jgi:hypothetical protein
MNFNTQEEREALKKSLLNTEDLNETLECLEHVLVHRTPFALYVATADRTDCMWIFDPGTVYEMVGGEKKYKEIYEEMFPTEEDKSIGVIFFILKKVGPLYSIRLSIEVIEEVIEELYENI